ncbi:hypothetical protein [uncultured Hymenobacter sp.]|uniref:hypothetical protein n=1 Tax=uncultured Hymenobacter sp. TaxID=170016 RepID=UPI0035CC83C0
MTLKKLLLGLLLAFPAPAWALTPSTLSGAVSPENKSRPALRRADSLFAAGQFDSAATLYKAQVWRGRQASPRLLLRLAYAQQQLGRPAAALLYLSMAQARQPRLRTWRQLVALAARQRLVGYPATWQQELRVQWQRYYYAGLQAMLAGVVVSIVFLLLRRRRAGPGWWAALAGYGLLAGAYLLLRPAPAALVARPGAALMAGPAAGAPWLSTATVGDRLLVLGRQDIWCRVRWQEREAFIRATDVLEVE